MSALEWREEISQKSSDIGTAIHNMPCHDVLLRLKEPGEEFEDFL